MKAGFGLAVTAAALIGGFTFVASHAGAQQPPPGDRPWGRQDRPRISAEDRAAFLDARLAGVRAGLRLSAEQEKLWPAFETAARDRAKTQMDLRQKGQDAGPPPNLVDGLRRHGEADIARGTADMRLADAAQPLWASLSEDQKRRFPMLARGIVNGGGPEQEEQGDRRPPLSRRDHGMGQGGPGPRGDMPPPPPPPPPR
jgi:zinc resistance-associated protein